MQRGSPNELDRVVNERRPKETFFSDVETKIERSWWECIGEDDLGAWHRGSGQRPVGRVEIGRVRRKDFDRVRSFVQVVAIGHYMD